MCSFLDLILFIYMYDKLIIIPNRLYIVLKSLLSSLFKITTRTRFSLEFRNYNLVRFHVKLRKTIFLLFTVPSAPWLLENETLSLSPTFQTFTIFCRLRPSRVRKRLHLNPFLLFGNASSVKIYGCCIFSVRDASISNII